MNLIVRTPVGTGKTALLKQAVTSSYSSLFLQKLLVVLFTMFALIGFNQKASAQLTTGDLAFTSFNADED